MGLRSFILSHFPFYKAHGPGPAQVPE